MNIICTICARGGSKGVKNKNILPIDGKPLIAHTLEQARQSQLFDYIVVSSDSDQILETAEQWGADILIKRPIELAGDTAAKIPVIRHAVLATEERVGKTFDIVFDLDATSPLRFVSDIIQSFEMFQQQQASNLITATPSRKSPYFNMVEVDQHEKVRLSKQRESHVVRRQDAPACYDMNASIYIWERASLFAHDSVFQDTTALYVMPEERSIDIDTPIDFELVRLILEKRSDT
jgi:CMP-N-acetylneuraminic acid synthetase